ncbi:hypothetical protein [Sporolactobacillus laevolacticus]|uniref:hypothetical protein n=1 Tax=Sporolactobacillus laevolacticus TaxID=33018 RepID=UPI0025B59769|nr:hypothetical protein [Sporolactobacillus laevolacticus]MDN3956525.1 hypothetical protein [Sporolactobacillus laevolacticus]
MGIVLYLLVISALLTFLPFPWHALVLLLNGIIICIYIITKIENKKQAFWQSGLIMALLVLILLFGWIIHFYLGVKN